MKLLITLTILMYGAVIADALRNHLGKSQFSKSRFLSTLGVSLIGHTYLLYRWIETSQGQDLSLSNIASMTTWIMGILIFISSFKKGMHTLAILIFPLSAISVLSASLSTHHHIVQTQLHPGMLAHILVSILATSVLGLSAVQATLIWGQNRWLKMHHPNSILRMLPPLETMESLLFSLIWAGFLLLTVSLITGLLYIEQFFSLSLLPKTGLSVLAWALFFTLLMGHHQYGWRGVKAVHFTLSGMFILFVAYFGTQFFFQP
jgi:ABC-type uncharacterized transport system permease subunit